MRAMPGGRGFGPQARKWLWPIADFSVRSRVAAPAVTPGERGSTDPGLSFLRRALVLVSRCKGLQAGDCGEVVAPGPVRGDAQPQAGPPRTRRSAAENSRSRRRLARRRQPVLSRMRSRWERTVLTLMDSCPGDLSVVVAAGDQKPVLRNIVATWGSSML